MLIHRLKVAGLLSFGPAGIDLPLEPLNVLIGPNGSGKSNLLEAIALLKAVPRDIFEPLSQKGGPARMAMEKARHRRLPQRSRQCSIIRGVANYATHSR